MRSVAEYDETFWRRVTARVRPRTLIGTLRRMVENQEQVVTARLTDDLEEQALLEAMLERSKPAPPPGTARLDYLLAAPWRYPPLRWGSRFGRRFEPSLFYGSLTENALFAEAAYYRWVFLAGLTVPFGDRVISQHTAFEAQFHARAGFDLRAPPFARHEAVLRHKANYAPSQALGTVLRERGADGITYLSARAAGDDANVALFSPLALRSRQHRRPRAWVCETTEDTVRFRAKGALLAFRRADFLYEGALPVPA